MDREIELACCGFRGGVGKPNCSARDLAEAEQNSARAKPDLIESSGIPKSVLS